MRDDHFRVWEEELENNTEKEGTCDGGIEEEGTWKPREEGTQISRLVSRERDQGERRMKRNLIWQLGATGILP